MDPSRAVFAIIWFVGGILFTIVSWYMVPLVINYMPAALQSIGWIFYFILIVFVLILAPIAIALGVGMED